MLQYATQSDFRASGLYCRHLRDLNMDVHRSQPFILAVTLLLRALSGRYSDVPRFADSILDMLSRVGAANFATARRVELEVLNIGRVSISQRVEAYTANRRKVHLSTNRFLGHYVPLVRSHLDPLYARTSMVETHRLSYRRDGSMLMRSLFRGLVQASSGSPLVVPPTNHMVNHMDDFMNSMGSNMGDLGFHSEPTPCRTPGLPYPNVAITPALHTRFNMDSVNERAPASPATIPSPSPSAGQGAGSGPSGASIDVKVESDTTCTLCGYRPKGDPKWFGGSMAKHMKLQHATTPPRIYRCPYPGCTSQFQKRPDNLRQHQIEKGHFVDGQGETSRRMGKRKKV